MLLMFILLDVQQLDDGNLRAHYRERSAKLAAWSTAEIAIKPNPLLAHAAAPVLHQLQGKPA
jgi:hypothetical protein